ncbi:hypothetical protein NA57DRAFT_51277 [Rhizodiscina lignyota]|uniref:Uncharacterized protein n=1 Tax=Rhizodiscina lignyota TaxID=1504668 RepID=A0A9P4ISA5_9PEZI|nr:hypothetical protein NA57DRAFT_51277 [Rhizodiscina lignyota]
MAIRVLFHFLIRFVWLFSFGAEVVAHLNSTNFTSTNSTTAAQSAWDVITSIGTSNSANITIASLALARSSNFSSLGSSPLTHQTKSSRALLATGPAPTAAFSVSSTQNTIRTFSSYSPLFRASNTSTSDLFHNETIVIPTSSGAATNSKSSDVLSSAPASAGNVSSVSTTKNGVPVGLPTLSTIETIVSGSTTAMAVLYDSGLSTPIFMIIPATTTLDPNSHDAKFTASSLSDNIIGVIPTIHSWIDQRHPPRATAVIRAIERILPPAERFLEEIGGSHHVAAPCGSKRRLLKKSVVARDLLSSLFNAAKCAIVTLQRVKNVIQNTLEHGVDNADDLSEVERLLEDLQDDAESFTEESEEHSSAPPSHVSMSSALTSLSSPRSLSHSSSTSSSCTSTAIVMDIHVTCLYTSLPGASGTPSKTCISFTSTTSGCTGTESTTTTTSTSASAILCGPKCSACNDDSPPPTSWKQQFTCSSCTTNSAGILQVPVATGVPKYSKHMGDPTLEDLEPTGPANISELTKRALEPVDSEWDPDVYLPRELSAANSAGTLLGHRSYQQTGGHSSSLHVVFGTNPVTTGVIGLRGCTSAVVISQAGAWISHFWEVPSFDKEQQFPTETQDEVFTRTVLDAISSGDGSNLLSGLGELTCQGHIFDPMYQPQAYVFTLRNRETPEQEGNLQYPRYVQAIKAQIGLLIPSLDPNGIPVHDYDSGGGSTWQDSYGKVLIEYDPVQEMQAVNNQGPEYPVAIARAFFETQLRPLHQKSWWAYPFQRQQPQQPQNPPTRKYKRNDGPACSKVLSSSKTENTRSLSRTRSPLKTRLSPNTLQPSHVSSSSVLRTASPTRQTLQSEGSSSRTQYSSRTLSAPRSHLSSSNKPHSFSTRSSSSPRPPSSPRSSSKAHIIIPAITTKKVKPTNSISHVSSTETQRTGLSGKWSVTRVTSKQSTVPFRSKSSVPPVAAVSGQDRLPTCAHVVVDDGEKDKLCLTDYCNCSGVVAPLLTTTISGTASQNCDYITQPTRNTCPPTPPLTTPPPKTPSGPFSSISATALPKTSASSLPYAPGTCRIEVVEFFPDDKPSEGPNVHLNVTDNSWKVLSYIDQSIQWGNSITISETDSKLKYDITVTFHKTPKNLNKKRDGNISNLVANAKRLFPPPSDNGKPLYFLSLFVSFVAGGSQWDTSNTNSNSYPHCNVGDWTSQPDGNDPGSEIELSRMNGLVGSCLSP